MTEELSPQFAGSLAAALAFWHGRAVSADIGRLDQERHNLHRAIEFGLTLPKTRPAAIEVALDAFQLVHARGYWREWLPILKEAIEICPPAQVSLKIKLLGRYGQMQRLNGRCSAAIASHEEELALAEKLDDPLVMGQAHGKLARAHWELRQHELAEHHCRAALALLDGKGGVAPLNVADALRTLGMVARRRGQYEQAIEYLDQAVVIGRQNGEPVALAEGLHELGFVYENAQQYEKALGCYDEGLQLLKDTEHLPDRFLLQYRQGVLLFQQQKWSQAELAFRAIDLSYLRQTGNVEYENLIMTALGNTILYQERFDEAAGYLATAVEFWRRREDKLELANAVGSLGEAVVGKGDYVAAQELFDEALALLSALPDHPRVVRQRAFFENERNKLPGSEL